jgi:ribosome-associated heat shock protein Hsp15
MIEGGHMRRNGQHITRTSEEIHVGDVLTFMLGTQVKIIEVIQLPERRSSPEMARSHYRELDRNTKSAIADDQHRELKGKTAT